MNRSEMSNSGELLVIDELSTRFIEAKNKVKERYMAIEEELLLEFSRAQVRNDKKAMKKYIKLLSKFKVTQNEAKICVSDSVSSFYSGSQWLHPKFYHGLFKSKARELTVIDIFEFMKLF